MKKLLLLVVMLQGCISSQLTHKESAEGFDWHTLKRDQILMTPLYDLRQSVKPDNEQLKFYTDKERIHYSQIFKESFFKLRKDIRVFGEGGAYEKVSVIPKLKEAAELAIAKQPLPEDIRMEILQDAQDIRFLFFFAITEESLDYGYVLTNTAASMICATKRYSAVRNFIVKMSMWDSKTNRVVWIGTQKLAPANVRDYSVKNPNAILSAVPLKDRKTICQNSDIGGGNLEQELQIRRARFPDFPGREPDFTKSFDDFALGFPIHPSEEKLIEYKYFTNHRPELDIHFEKTANKINPILQLGTSSIITNRWRIGGALLFPGAVRGIKYAEKDYTISWVALTATVDTEWQITDYTRFLIGSYLGGSIFNVTDEAQKKAEDSTPDVSGKESTAVQSDGAIFLWPRVQMLWGEKQGLQYGVGGAYRLWYGIENDVLQANTPSPWMVSLVLGYTVRGF